VRRRPDRHAIREPDFGYEVPLSEKDACQKLAELFESAVTMRMRSDVPLGAFLSGGIDSSLVAAVMQKNAAEPVKTFSIGFSVKEYDETKYARLVANHLKTEHHELTVTPDALAIWTICAGTTSSFAAPQRSRPGTYPIATLVALSGDGGDEPFLGYSRYRAVALMAGLTLLALVPSRPDLAELPPVATEVPAAAVRGL
jgi:asparagine synthase (glutamine-hydrolysing)